MEKEVSTLRGSKHRYLLSEPINEHNNKKLDLMAWRKYQRLRAPIPRVEVPRNHECANQD